MEHVWLIANTSFVNRWTGSVNKKQRFFCPENIAEEFVAMGIARYATPKTEAAEEETEKKSNPSQPQEGDGMEQQSALSPAETASTGDNLTQQPSEQPETEQTSEQPEAPAETASTGDKKGKKSGK
jgi:hypothetical protein